VALAAHHLQRSACVRPAYVCQQTRHRFRLSYRGSKLPIDKLDHHKYTVSSWLPKLQGFLNALEDRVGFLLGLWGWQGFAVAELDAAPEANGIF